MKNLLILLSIIFISGCASMAHIPEPKGSWQPANTPDIQPERKITNIGSKKTGKDHD